MLRAALTVFPRSCIRSADFRQAKFEIAQFTEAQRSILRASLTPKQPYYTASSYFFLLISTHRIIFFLIFATALVLRLRR